jgi:hypothetical protein
MTHKRKRDPSNNSNESKATEPLARRVKREVKKEESEGAVIKQELDTIHREVAQFKNSVYCAHYVFPLAPSKGGSALRGIALFLVHPGLTFPSSQLTGQNQSSTG